MREKPTLGRILSACAGVTLLPGIGPGKRLGMSCLGHDEEFGDNVETFRCAIVGWQGQIGVLKVLLYVDGCGHTTRTCVASCLAMAWRFVRIDLLLCFHLN